MVDEITISDYALNAPPRFRVVAEGDQTVIRAYDTNEPLWRINGKIGGGGVEDMTTTQRMSITPELGELIFDTTLGALFVGDGVTVGGIAVGGGEDDIPGNRLYSDGEFLNFNPVADIVNVSGSSVTLQPDTAYKILATTGAVNVTANPPAANKWAYEGHAEIFVGSVGYVVFDTSKIVLANQLEPDSVNNCTLRFHDGMCYVSVEDHIAGYVVISAAGTTAGTLPYAVSTAAQEYVAFDASLNGTTIDLSGSTANGEKHIVGNGYTETTLTGAVDCGTSKFTIANLSLQNVQVTGGVMTLGDAFIPGGSTVAVATSEAVVDGVTTTVPLGSMAVEKVTGAGSTSVIDLGGTHIEVPANTIASISGCSFVGGSAPGSGRGGALRLYGSETIVDVTISGNTGYTGGGIALFNGNALISSCGIYGNTAVHGKDVRVDSSTLTVVDCILGGVMTGQNGKLVLSGSNTIDSVQPRSSTLVGSVTLASGAILDLTGNTNSAPIAPGGGITFVSGGATVKVGDSTASSSYMMDNVTLPAGAKLTNTAVVDLDSSTIVPISGQTVKVSGATLTGAAIALRGDYAGTDVVLSSCTLQRTGGTNPIRWTIGTLDMMNCVCSGDVFCAPPVAGIEGESEILLSETFALRGGRVYKSTGNATSMSIASGAIVDLTGNTNSTPINPGGGVIVDGGCQVITSAGTTVSIAGGTYTKINNDGTTE